MSGWLCWFALMAYLGAGFYVYSLARIEKDEDQDRSMFVAAMLFWPAFAVFMGLVSLQKAFGGRKRA